MILHIVNPLYNSFIKIVQYNIPLYERALTSYMYYLYKI